MTNADHDNTESKIKSDEAWKEKVKAEDARLDAERSHPETFESPSPSSEEKDSAPTDEKPAPSPSSTESPDIDASQLPKPEFATLVGLFSTQAMVSLGLIGHPEDGKLEVQLPLVRHFIDLLGVLDEKTKGNLTDGEAQLLEQSLHDLRMAFMERSRGQS